MFHLTGSHWQEAFAEFSRRCPCSSAPLGYFFDKRNRTVNFDDIESIVSVGPYEGSFDVKILPSFPNCRSYVGLEPIHCACDKLQQAMDRSFPFIECKALRQRFEDWEGPEKPVDMVLASHVLYDQFNIQQKEAIQRFMTWLKPGGILIVIHRENQWLEGWKPDAYLGPELVADFEDLALNVIEEVTFMTTADVRQISRPLLNFFATRICSDQEVTELRQRFSSMDFVDAVYVVRVVQK